MRGSSRALGSILCLVSFRYVDHRVCISPRLCLGSAMRCLLPSFTSFTHSRCQYVSVQSFLKEVMRRRTGLCDGGQPKLSLHSCCLRACKKVPPQMRIPRNAIPTLQSARVFEKGFRLDFYGAQSESFLGNARSFSGRKVSGALVN